MFTLNLVTRSRRIVWRDVAAELAQSPHDLITAATDLLAAAVAEHNDIVDAEVCRENNDYTYQVLAYWHAGRVLAGDWRDAEGL